jgi:hypothetical protein
MCFRLRSWSSFAGSLRWIGRIGDPSTSTAPHSVDIDGELAKLDADGYRPLRATP